jgi:transcriptional regulator with XRE-family HTH domain
MKMSSLQGCNGPAEQTILAATTRVLEPALSERRQGPRFTPKPYFLPTSAFREEELWAGESRLIACFTGGSWRRDLMAANAKGSTKKVGRLIRSARMERGLTQKDLARKLGVRSGSYVGMLESGLCKGVGVGRLEEIATFLDVHGVDRYRWLAAAGHLPPGLLGALMKSPDQWDDILGLLGGGAPRSSRGRRRARA